MRVRRCYNPNTAAAEKGSFQAAKRDYSEVIREAGKRKSPAQMCANAHVVDGGGVGGRGVTGRTGRGDAASRPQHGMVGNLRADWRGGGDEGERGREGGWEGDRE